MTLTTKPPSLPLSPYSLPSPLPALPPPPRTKEQCTRKRLEVQHFVLSPALKPKTVGPCWEALWRVFTMKKQREVRAE